MYFPFLDQDTKKVMQKAMDEAYSYYDFVQRLNERVLAEESPDLLIYFAIHHSALLYDMDSIQLIAQQYGKISILRPNLFYASVHQGNLEDVAKVHEAADAILASNPPKWLAAEMRFLKFEVDLLQYPKILYDSSNLEILMEMIEKSPELEFYDNILYDCLGVKAMRDGDTEEVIRCTERSIESAEKCNDVVRLAYHLRTKARYLQKTNLVLAKYELLRARDIMDSLGNQAGIASMLYHLSRLEAIRGEYNLAIERNLEVIRIRELLDLPRGVYAIMLATLYNVTRNPRAGLEWARLAEIDFESDPAIKPRALLNQAWSFILMGERAQAMTLIDSVREEIMKSGLEFLLGWLSFVSGLLEWAEGDLASAAKSIEDALEIYEKKGSLDNALIFMHHLAQLDVILADTSSQKPLDDYALPWLSLLEEKSISDDLPGIFGQVHLLKARLAVALSDDDALRESINELRLLGKESSMEFLNIELEWLLERV
jgi:hypothetical protein